MNRPAARALGERASLINLQLLCYKHFRINAASMRQWYARKTFFVRTYAQKRVV